MSPEAVERLYDQDYYAGNGFDDSVSYTSDDEGRQAAAIDALNAIEQLRPGGSSLLDYGCGLGELVAAASHRGWGAAGFEVSEFAAEYARHRGLSVFQRVQDIPAESFDVVAAIEVLEHCHSPREALQTMYRALRPGGVLYYTTANFDGYRGDPVRLLRPWRWPALDEYVKPEGHIHFFSSEVMRHYFRLIGFERVVFRPTTYPRRSRLIRALRLVKLADRTSDHPLTQMQGLTYQVALAARAVVRGRYLPVARK